MELKYYLRTLSRGWWLILLTTLISLEVALVLDYIAAPIYRASARFAISPNITQLDNSSDILYSLDTLDKRSVVTTYAEFLNSDRIYNETLTSLNIDSASMAGYIRNTNVIPDSNVLELTVEGTDPNVVAMLANSIGERAITVIKELYSAYDISFLDPAVPSKTPVRPVPLRDASLALVLGLVLGSGLAILRDQIQTSLDTYRQQSNLDKVSKAYNRTYLIRRMEQELVRYPDTELSFGLVQLSGLQDVIEILPQNMTQDLMRTVTQTFQKELRGSDMIARWDEITYAILLPKTSAAAAQRTINRLCATITQPVNLRAYGESINLQPLANISTSEANESAEQVISRTQATLKRMADLLEEKDLALNPDGKAEKKGIQ